jgi:DNA-binding LytR/AlgR family response regulator
MKFIKIKEHDAYYFVSVQNIAFMATKGGNIYICLTDSTQFITELVAIDGNYFKTAEQIYTYLQEEE